MSLSALKTAAYDLMQVASPSAADDVTLLMCFNHARLQAERKHDFEMSKGTAYLSVAATTGSAISGAQAELTAEAPSGATVSIKSIRRGTKVRNNQATGWVDAEIMSYDKYQSLIARANREAPYDVIALTTDPEQSLNVFDTRNVLYIDGPNIYTPNSTTVLTQLRVYKWLDTYASFDATADFIITYAPDYLLWSAILQFNHKKGVFIPRNEGSLDPGSPQAQANAAWEALLLWDTFMVGQGSYIISE